MQVSLETVGTLERKLTVRIPADRVETRVRERMRELGQTVRIKGFRPGKVPAKIIEQRFGAQVRNEAMSDVITTSYQEAVREKNLRPAVAPSIRANPAGAGEIEYTATFEVVPEIGAIDVSGIELTKVISSVEDADVDAMIETLRLQRRGWDVVERASQTGDMVLFEYAATAGDLRHPAEGAERAGTVIGIGALFPEFEAQLVGVKTGDERKAKLTFPEAFRETSLAGKTADVEIKIVRVQEPKLPEVDEAFAASFGVREGGLARFREDVRANLERELNAAVKSRVKAHTVDRLVAHFADIEVPKGMVNNESQALLQRAQQQAQRVGATPPSDANAFAAEASARVRAFLLLNEIARQNNIVPDSRLVNEALGAIASTYEEPEKVVELYLKDNELMASLRNSVLEDQVVEWIVQHAKGREERVPFSQVMQARG